MWNIPGLADAASRIAVAFQAAPQGTAGKVLAQLGPWTQRLFINASDKWLPRLMSPATCEVPHHHRGRPAGPCYQQAMPTCMICKRPCCLDHCLVDQFGDAVCYLCVMEMAHSKRAEAAANGVPGPGPFPWEQGPPNGNGKSTQEQANKAAVRAAYRTLGVAMSCTDDELRSALRLKLAKNHPDRVKGERAKAKAEERFKEINAAYEIIMKSRGKGARA